MAEPKRGILLDVDGTLWDAVEVITDSWNEALKACPDVEHEITVEQMGQCLGKTMVEIGDRLFPFLSPARRREVLDTAMRFEVEYLRDHPGTIYPSVRETLRALSSGGWHLYIVSNCQKGYIEDFLLALGMDGLIEDHLCFEDTMQDKGSNIRLCVERNSLDKAFYVGDTMGDLVASRKAGIPFVYAGYGFGDVDAQIQRVPRIDRFDALLSVAAQMEPEQDR